VSTPREAADQYYDRDAVSPDSPNFYPDFGRARRHTSYIELRLPSDAYEKHDLVSELGRGSTWIGKSGLVVSYQVQTSPPRQREIGRGDRNVLVCSGRLGGRLAAIRAHYSESTTVPGQYVGAILTLSDGQSLILSTFHPDSSRRDEMLDVLSSLRFPEQ
jgi:hypothetical protein